MRRTARRTDHCGQTVLSAADCWLALTDATVGRVALVAGGTPTILPVNFVIDGLTVAFRCAPGVKTDAAAVGTAAAFEVDQVDELTRRGWSVLLRGTLELVDDPDEVAHLEAIADDPWTAAEHDLRWLRLRPDDVSGRALRRR